MLVFAIAAGVAAALLVGAVRRDLITDVRSTDEATLADLETSLLENPIDTSALADLPGGGPPVFTVDSDGNLTPRSVDQVAGQPFVVIGGAGAPRAFRDGDTHLRPPGPTPGDNGREPAGRPRAGGDRVRPPRELDVYDPIADELKGADALGLIPDNYEVTRIAVPSDKGPLVLAAATPLDEVNTSVSTVTRQLWFVLPALVVLVGVMAWLLTGRALRPVALLTGRVRDISGSTLHERVPESGAGDEIADLARTMNDMLDRLEQSAVRQRQFVSDASHELRTPVAAIRTELEVALREPGVTDWPAVAGDVLAEDARLERLVADLLTLARSDEQPTPVDAPEVDLDDLVRAESGRPWPTPVHVGRLDPARVRGRSAELQQMIGHLLANATRHAAAEVTVQLTAGPERCYLSVSDDGRGVPEGDRERIFERFTRLAEGRERDAGGAGLGLAVVRRVVDRHGGEVSVRPAPGGGADFVVSLPITR
jgi:signal transduction histidine kinase